MGAGDDQIRSGDEALAHEGAGAATGDRIDPSAIDANTETKRERPGGNQAFLFDGTGRGHVTLVDEVANTVIHANTDGDAAFEFDLLIADGAISARSYTAADFIL